MLAAILLNLPDYQNPRDADAGKVLRARRTIAAYKNDTRAVLRAAAEQIEALATGKAKPKARKVVQTAKALTESVEPQQSVEILAELAIQIEELRMVKVAQPDILLEWLLIAQLAIEDDEEVALILAMTE